MCRTCRTSGIALSGFRFEAPKLTKAVEEFRPSGSWRTVVDPILGELAYSSE